MAHTVHLEATTHNIPELSIDGVMALCEGGDWEGGGGEGKAVWITWNAAIAMPRAWDGLTSIVSDVAALSSEVGF